MARKQDKKKLFTLKDMCRGDGKIYAVIVPVSELVGYTLTASSATVSGRAVPAKVLDWRQGDYRVLVLPILDVTQKVTISALDDQGIEVASEVHSINRHVARAHSVANRLRKNENLRSICDCDDRAGANECTVRFVRFIGGGKRPGSVLQGYVSLYGSSRDEVSGDIELQFISGTGGEAALAPWVTMRDEIVTHPEYADLFIRELQFSARIDEGPRNVTVWALPKREGAPQGFRTLDSAGFGRMLDDWYLTTRIASLNPSYDSWYRTEHAVGAAEARRQTLTRFPYEPTFSIIVPLYQTPVNFFREMVDSVLRQTYSKLELVLVNASPGDEKLAGIVAEYAAADERVVSVVLDENKGITENTNAGIAAATGDFLCFLDHDDTLTDDALFCYARALNKYPDTDLLYSDEDHIDANGLEYFTPYFKPDWNPDLILGMNYICHFMCVRKSIVDEFEPATKEFDGSQDHHMAIRVSEKARNIYHERRVLYHWRVHPGSTADSIDAKPYAVTAGLRAVQSHIERCGIKGKAVHPAIAPLRYEIEYELEEEPLVSILIPTKDNVAMLDRCLRSILEKSTYGNFEIIIIENNSEDEATFAYYEEAKLLDDRIRVVTYEGPFNYSAINNFGAGFAQGEYLLLLNNDTEVITENWLERMLALCMRDNTGAVGVKLMYPDGTIQHCGVISTPNGPGHVNMYRDIGDGGYADNAFLRQDVPAVTGACLMTEKALFDRIGGLDENLAVSYNDIDYCYAVQKEGLLVVLDPGVELFHYESASRGYEVSLEKKLRFTRERAILMGKWPERFTVPDPWSNPHLSQTGGYFQAGF